MEGFPKKENIVKKALKKAVAVVSIGASTLLHSGQADAQKVEPFKISSPTEFLKRQQAYKDSLEASQGTQKLIEEQLKKGRKYLGETNETYGDFKGIKPQKAVSYGTGGGRMLTETESFNFYKAPVQPVTYQPEEKNIKKKIEKEFVKYYDDPEKYKQAMQARKDSSFMYNQSQKINDAAKKMQDEWNYGPEKEVEPLMQGKFNNLLRSEVQKPVSSKEYKFWNGTDEGGILNVGVHKKPVVIPKLREREQPKDTIIQQPPEKAIQPVEIGPTLNPGESLQPHTQYPNIDIIYIDNKATYFQNKAGERIPYGQKFDKEWQYHGVVSSK